MKEHTKNGILKSLILLGGFGSITLTASLFTGCGPQDVPQADDTDGADATRDMGDDAMEETAAASTDGRSSRTTQAVGNAFSSGTNTSGNQRSGGVTTQRTSSGGMDYISARTWTDTKGRTMEAQLQEFTKEIVQLRDQAGDVKSLSRSILSIDDNDWLDLVEMSGIPKFEPADDAPEFFKIIDTVDGVILVNADVKEYGNLGVTVVPAGGTEVHLPYNKLNKSHLRKIGYPVDPLDQEVAVTTSGNPSKTDS